MKTSFVFWAISLSFIMASLLMKLITSMVLIDPSQITFRTLNSYLTFYAILFIIALITFLLIFQNIYGRLMHQYYILTGTTSLEGKIREGYQFLYGSNHVETNKNSIILSKKFIPILGIIIIVPQLFIPLQITSHILVNNYYVDSSSSYIYLNQLIHLLTTPYWELMVFPSILLVINIALITLSLIKNYKRQWMLVVSYYLWFVSTIPMYYMVDSYRHVDFFIGAGVGHYSLIMMLILTVILIIRSQVKNKKLLSKEL